MAGTLLVVLEIPAAVHAEMIGHAVAGLPDEACGLFAGPTGETTGDDRDDRVDRVDRFFPMGNAAASSRIYELDGQELMDVEREADDAGVAILGVMHSHTHTTDYPSPTDVADAARFDPFGTWRFIIVSLKHPDPSLRCYRIADGEVTEERVVITD